MSIAGVNSRNADAVNAANYMKANRKEDGFEKKVMKCVQAGSQKVMLCSDALKSYASPQTGESVNIYRADNYSKENPIYLLKGLDAFGNEFEKEVDASKIDPAHCSYNELMVLNVETGNTSDRLGLSMCAIRDKIGTGSYFDKANYIAGAQAAMKDYKILGCWSSYLALDKWIQSAMAYAEAWR